ncbi:DUF2281 domain-containing protein [Phormidesmis sp. 146-33]
MNAAEKIYELVKEMPEAEANEVLTFVETLRQKGEASQVTQDTDFKNDTQSGRLLSDYAGILKNSPNFNEDPVELQRRMRDEWS